MASINKLKDQVPEDDKKAKQDDKEDRSERFVVDASDLEVEQPPSDKK